MGSITIKCGVSKVVLASLLEAERVSPAAGAHEFPRISFLAAFDPATWILKTRWLSL